MFSHCTSITELILKRFHAYSGFSLQLNITNCILFKGLSSCTAIHGYPLAALGVECLKCRCRAACRKGRTRNVSHAGVQVPCTVTIMMVSAPLHKQDLQITLHLLCHPARLTLLLREQPSFWAQPVSLCSVALLAAVPSCCSKHGCGEVAGWIPLLPQSRLWQKAKLLEMKGCKGKCSVAYVCSAP